MANEIQDAFDAVYLDGPAGAPYEPPKSEIRDIVGATIQAEVDAAKALATVSTNWVDPVRVALGSNWNIATGLQNGQSAQSLTLATGDRVALYNQTDKSQNGIYVVVASGAASRSTDANTAAEVSGLAFYVEEGANAGKQFICSTTGTITLGTTDLTFSIISDQSALNADLAELQTALQSTETGIIGDPAWALDLDGVMPITVNQSGETYLIPSPEGTAAIADKLMPVIDGTVGDYAAGLVVDGYVVLGINQSGEVDFEPSDQLLAKLGTSAADADSLNAIPDEANVWSVTGAGSGVLRFFANQFEIGADTVTRAYLQRAGELWSMADVRGYIEYFAASGQSLDLGRVQDADTHVVTDVAPVPSYGLMLNTGLRGVFNQPVSAATLTGFLPAVEVYNDVTFHGETGGASMMRWLHKKARASSLRDRVYCYRASGVGGFRLDQLNKAGGGQAYQNQMIEIAAAMNIADIYGKDLIVRAVPWSQGEQDDADGTAYATYLASLSTLIDDYNTDIKALNSQTDDVHLIIDQRAGPGGSSAATMSTLAQYRAAQDDPLIHIATPKYFMQYGDSVHLTAEWYAIRGEYYAKCYHALFVAEAGWTGLRPDESGVSLVGDTITLPTEGKVGNLVVDTTTVPAATNHGFVYSDDGGTIGISSVSLNAGTGVITITLSGTPSATNKKLSYARGASGTPGDTPYAGSIGNIRDSDTTASYAGHPTYTTLPNWLQSFTINL